MPANHAVARDAKAHQFFGLLELNYFSCLNFSWLLHALKRAYLLKVK